MSLPSRNIRDMYHPWHVLRDEWPHIHVEYVDEIPGDRMGETDGRIIRLARQLQVERRCTLAHELIHLEKGDSRDCSPAVDAEIDREAARRLIPWPCRLEPVRWARSTGELGEELWVTEEILHARVATLHAGELLELGHAIQA